MLKPYEYFLEERFRQIEKWGNPPRLNTTWLPILLKQVGQLSGAILDSDQDRVLHQLIQIGAVAAAWIEQLDDRLEDR